MSSSTEKPPFKDAIAEILHQLSIDKAIRRDLPKGGSVSIDRCLPFLCLYREPPGKEDPGTCELVTGTVAYFCLSGESASLSQSRRAVEAIAETSLKRFGALLLVAISAEEEAHPQHKESGEEIPPGPKFNIHCDMNRVPWRTVESLERALGRIRMFRQRAEVETSLVQAPLPAEVREIIPNKWLRTSECYVLGLRVSPIYRRLAFGTVYPSILRGLRRRLGNALGQALFTFVRTHTTIRPSHYYALGRRAIVKSVWEVDRKLAEAVTSFDLLLQATPLNAEVAWREFKKSDFQKKPIYHYRPCAVEPTLLKRKLMNIPLEKIEDPTLSLLFREQQDELDRKITMLADIGTSRFLAGSVQVYGKTDEHLVSIAKKILEETTPKRGGGGKSVGALEFADQVRRSVARYQRDYPAFTARVLVREDLFSGLLVSGDTLLVGANTRMPRKRVQALLAHEVETHLLTHFNGRAQPFKQLACGMPNYDGLQEGLAVFSEYLVGGLSVSRLRLLAARVLAVDSLLQGASFVDTFRLLRKEYRFAQKVAYTVTMRVFRGGGLTKDAVYLRGIVELLDYLKKGGKIEPLFVGKISAEHIPIVEELRLRKVLHHIPLRPAFLEEPVCKARLNRASAGMHVLDLLEEYKA